MAKKKNISKPKKNFKIKGIRLTLHRKQSIIFGSFLLLLAVILAFSFSSYFFTWKADQSILGSGSVEKEEVGNLIKRLGAALGNLFVYKGFGIAALMLAYLTGITGLSYLLEAYKTPLKKRWFWGLLIMVWTATLFGFFNTTGGVLAGTVGFELNDVLQLYLGKIGTIILLLFTFIIFAVLRLNMTPEKNNFTF
jgi:S-DNA-T family DNA segregation ATPase FtsK/SpoIIIE